MNILFVHKENKLTVAMEELPIWLLNELEIGNTLERKVGIAKCSKKDRFVKDTGRKLSLSRMKLKKLKVVDTVVINNSRRVTFKDDSNNNFHLVHYKNTGSVFFMDFLEDLND